MIKLYYRQFGYDNDVEGKWQRVYANSMIEAISVSPFPADTKENLKCKYLKVWIAESKKGNLWPNGKPIIATGFTLRTT